MAATAAAHTSRRSRRALIIALHTDIWDVVAEILRGDTSTLRGCALLSTASCGSMQRELFRTITLRSRLPDSAYRLLELLTARPSLASYIRRLEVRKVALNVLTDFARPVEATFRLACVQDLRIEYLDLRSKDEHLFLNMLGCFPSLLVLELYYCPALHMAHTNHLPCSACTLLARLHTPRRLRRHRVQTGCRGSTAQPQDILFHPVCKYAHQHFCGTLPQLGTSGVLGRPSQSHPQPADIVSRFRHKTPSPVYPMQHARSYPDHTTHKLEVQLPSCGM
jgi:hypothetical protein